MDQTKETRFEKKDASATGYFHYAVTYWHSAVTLEKTLADLGHRRAPINYLYFHAIELFMKSFLLKAGKSHRDVISFRHDQVKIASEAKRLGLELDARDMEMLELNNLNYLDARYLRTGPTVMLPGLELWGLCSDLYDQVVSELTKGAARPRLLDRPDFPYGEDASLTVEEALK